MTYQNDAAFMLWGNNQHPCEGLVHTLFEPGQLNLTNTQNKSWYISGLFAKHH